MAIERSNLQFSARSRRSSAGEVAKRESIYADFIMIASNMLIFALTHDDFSPGGDEQRLVGRHGTYRRFL